MAINYIFIASLYVTIDFYFIFPLFKIGTTYLNKTCIYKRIL